MGRLRVGRVGSGLGDEVVAVVIEGEPPEVEIQCHGGSAAVALVVEALEAEAGRGPIGSSLGSGMRAARRSEPRPRSPWPRPRRPKVAAILLDQAEGALDGELRRVARSGAELGRSPVWMP